MDYYRQQLPHDLPPGPSSAAAVEWTREIQRDPMRTGTLVSYEVPSEGGIADTLTRMNGAQRDCVRFIASQFEPGTVVVLARREPDGPMRITSFEVLAAVGSYVWSREKARQWVDFLHDKCDLPRKINKTCAWVYTTRNIQAPGTGEVQLFPYWMMLCEYFVRRHLRFTNTCRLFIENDRVLSDAIQTLGGDLGNVTMTALLTTGRYCCNWYTPNFECIPYTIYWTNSGSERLLRPVAVDRRASEAHWSAKRSVVTEERRRARALTRPRERSRRRSRSRSPRRRRRSSLSELEMIRAEMEELKRRIAQPADASTASTSAAAPAPTASSSKYQHRRFSSSSSSSSSDDDQAHAPMLLSCVIKQEK